MEWKERDIGAQVSAQSCQDKAWTIVEILEKRANEGDSHAALILALYYLYGIGVRKSNNKAAEYLERVFELTPASDVGDKLDASFIARFKLGRFLKDNDGFENLKSGTSKQFKSFLGFLHNIDSEEEDESLKEEDKVSLYYSGIEMLQDYESPIYAFPKFKKSAKLGYGYAQYVLACMYVRGLGTKRSVRMWKKWLEAAVENKCFPAMYELGMCYYYGRGIPKDREYGMMLLEESAKLDAWEKHVIRVPDQFKVEEWQPEYQLGKIYFKLSKSSRYNLQRALEHYEKAAMLGHEYSKIRVLEMLEGCKKELPRDIPRAEMMRQKELISLSRCNIIDNPEKPHIEKLRKYAKLPRYEVGGEYLTLDALKRLNNTKVE